VKLNTGYGTNMGAVMVYQNNAWKLICDSGLDLNDAMVICRELGYPYGTFLTGGVFGAVPGSTIGINNVRCRGTEKDFGSCMFDVSTSCRSGNYASVVCGQQPFQETSEKKLVLCTSPHEK
jgi:deleted-in-malignant-brain-tumors protein 1